MNSIYSGGLVGLWVLFWGYWYTRAQNSSKGERVEANESRVIHFSLIGAAALLLALGSFFPFDIRLLPKTDWIFACGFVLSAMGFALAIWARSHLGKYWSGAIIFQDDHKLIQSGPYALTRHPIYTGILTGILGTSIALGEVRGFVALACAFLAYFRKMKMEEIWLVRQFGAEYSQYKKRVRMVVPFIV
jgi:protein-S-isoprenylcysteine O-methyltransferase Ste14